MPLTAAGLLHDDISGVGAPRSLGRAGQPERFSRGSIPRLALTDQLGEQHDEEKEQVRLGGYPRIPLRGRGMCRAQAGLRTNRLVGCVTTRRIRVATSVTGHRREVDVWVYDTQTEMLAAAAAFDPRDSDWSEETHGCCQYFPYLDQDERALMAVVRLHRGHLYSDVIAHEMLHAAAHFCAIDHGNENGDYVTSGSDERIAHAFSELFNQAMHLL